MNNYTYAAGLIKERVSMPAAIALYAPNPPPKHNRIPCPVHGGTNYNLGFTDRLYHCFVCGSGGDVIHLVQHIFGLDFPAALDKLNTDFQCGIPLDRRMTLRERRDAERKLRTINPQRSSDASWRRAYETLYNALHGEYERLNRNRVLYAPQSRDEEWHPLFCEALQRLDYVQYIIDTLL